MKRVSEFLGRTVSLHSLTEFKISTLSSSKAMIMITLVSPAYWAPIDAMGHAGNFTYVVLFNPRSTAL